MDPLDSIWMGIKLGALMIGMVLMFSLWRGIWRNKSAKEQKDK